VDKVGKNQPPQQTITEAADSGFSELYKGYAYTYGEGPPNLMFQTQRATPPSCQYEKLENKWYLYRCYLGDVWL
jgi:hypothetical protein